VGLYKAVGNAASRIQPEMQSKSMAIEEYGSFITCQASIWKHLITTFGNPTGPQLSLHPQVVNQMETQIETLHHPVTIMGVMKHMLMEYRKETMMVRRQWTLRNPQGVVLSAQS